VQQLHNIELEVAEFAIRYLQFGVIFGYFWTKTAWALIYSLLNVFNILQTRSVIHIILAYCLLLVKLVSKVQSNAVAEGAVLIVKSTVERS